MQRSKKPLLIGELARQGGVKADSIRFYERGGLLPKPERGPNGYRVYDESALSRLRFIKKAQALGFSLEEIRRILNLHGNPKETCRCVIAMAESTLAETERRAEQLHSFAAQLRSNLERWRKISPRRDRMATEFCALIESREISPGNEGPVSGINAGLAESSELRSSGELQSSKRKSNRTMNAETKETIVSVEGMSCVSCTGRIKRILTSIAGVQDAEVNLDKKEARIRHDAREITPERLATVINELGYKANVQLR